jgi:hypothetical protein
MQLGLKDANQQKINLAAVEIQEALYGFRQIT